LVLIIDRQAPMQRKMGTKLWQLCIICQLRKWLPWLLLQRNLMRQNHQSQMSQSILFRGQRNALLLR